MHTHICAKTLIVLKKHLKDICTQNTNIHINRHFTPIHRSTLSKSLIPFKNSANSSSHSNEKACSMITIFNEVTWVTFANVVFTHAN